MSYQFYKILHLTGIIMIFMGLAGAAVHTINGGQKSTNRFRRGLAIIHGVGMTFALVAGFGLLARLGLTDGIPVWAWIKLVIWGLLGAAIAVVQRSHKLSKPTFWVLIILFVLASYLANYKPI